MSLSFTSRLPWYALTVKHHHEKVVSQALEGRGLEHYLPLYRSFHRSGGRMQPVMLPLFPGFVFCSFDISNRLPVLTIPGVGSIVSIGRAPAEISESELENVERMVGSDLNIASHPALVPGEDVCIDRGPLQGLYGKLVATKSNYRLVVSISLLQRAVSAEVELGWVRPVRNKVYAA